MNLSDIVAEIRITKKEPYGAGDRHNIYSSLKDKTKLFKVKKDGEDVDMSCIDIFKAHPEVFPKVYRSNDRGAEVENLNAKKAQMEFEDLNHVLNSDEGEGFWQLLFDIASGKNKERVGEYIKEYYQHLKENDPRLVVPFTNYIKLVDKISKVTGMTHLDIHSGNFGYDKSGKLKMIDI